jgi:secreted trypsin-like serine protease
MNRPLVTRSLAALLVIATVVLARGTPARAITGTYRPDTTHTYVGLAVFYDQNGEFVHRCSGSLIAPSVFLTAGHCTDDSLGLSYARIYFQQDAGAHYDPVTQHDPISGYPDECMGGDPLCVTGHTLVDYGFDEFAGFPNVRDLGIVLLDQPVTFTREFALLAAPGSLDTLLTNRRPQNTAFVVSGYGLSDNWPAKKEATSFRVRLMADTKLNNVNNRDTGGFNLQTSSAPGNGRGGICSGDSGGPVLWGSTDIIAGITSFTKNDQCLGNDYSYRVDQQAAIDWILGVAATVGEATQVTVVPLG